MKHQESDKVHLDGSEVRIPAMQYAASTAIVLVLWVGARASRQALYRPSELAFLHEHMHMHHLFGSTE